MSGYGTRCNACDLHKNYIGHRRQSDQLAPYCSYRDVTKISAYITVVFGFLSGLIFSGGGGSEH